MCEWKRRVQLQGHVHRKGNCFPPPCGLLLLPVGWSKGSESGEERFSTRSSVTTHGTGEMFGGGCDRHLVGRGQGYSKTSCNAQKRMIEPQNTDSAEVEKHVMHVCTSFSWRLSLYPDMGLYENVRHRRSQTTLAWIPYEENRNALSLPGSL